MKTPSTETQRHRDEETGQTEQAEQTEPRKERDPCTSRIIAAAIEVHRNLGPGLLELVYEECLCQELGLRGIAHQRQVMIPIIYKGVTIPGVHYRIDIIVEDKIILEIKAVEQILRVHKAQLLSYMRITGKPKGLLLNFNVPRMAEGITRMAL